MGMLDRYKKKGGFFQLLQLLETSPMAKREQFLGLIAGESPAWEDALRKRILTIDKVYSWDQQYLVEIFSRLPPLTLANALHGMETEKVEGLLGTLPPISKRKITDLLLDSNPNAGEKATCISKILTEVRGFIAQGILKLEKVDPELLIPENIEEMLNAGGFTTPLVFEAEPTKKEAKSATPVSESSEPMVPQQEVDFFKRKVNQLVSELNALKHENTVLKDKLAQIKKIA
ncbi:MAG: hypothetical protein HUU57_05540 [Bdellovibrio sp.]|nr:hypothetical protein [Bdellovibrio sp.]